MEVQKELRKVQEEWVQVSMNLGRIGKRPNHTKTLGYSTTLLYLIVNWKAPLFPPLFSLFSPLFFIFWENIDGNYG